MASQVADTWPESDTVVGAAFDVNEQAQLLAPEELGFEDSTHAHWSSKKQRVGFIGRLQGPQRPQIQIIQPFLPNIQTAPAHLLDWILPRKRSQLFLLGGFLLLWFLVFASYLSSQLPVEDGTGRQVINLDCADTLWRRKNECGLNGIDCRPFTNNSFSFRCPSNCGSVQVLNPHAVGPLDVNYRSLVIGDDVYRGDSFLCAAAIHAGVVTNAKGGCGHVTLVGKGDAFPSVDRNGIESIAFDSYFPLSFSLSSDASFHCATDPRAALLFISIFFTTILSLFWTSPKMFFPTFTLIFAHVSFASDPPSASYRNVTVLPDHMSMFAKGLLPAFFCAAIIYRTTAKRSLSGLTASVEKTVLWLGGFFFGALSNYTFTWIPISRLTVHDLEQQPGAKASLAAILIVLAVIIAGQMYYFWLEGRLLQYLALYGLFALGVVFCLMIPGVSLRIHHYIIALLLLPGTGLQTRPSLLYQGILLGLFVNGIARWDFDSVLQTTDALRSDAKLDSALPGILEPVITLTAGGLVAAFSWALPSSGVDGISVLINDVERHRAFFYDGDDDNDAKTFEWARPTGMQLNEYVRFAYMKDGRTQDYTEAGTLFGNGTWTVQQRT